MVATRCHILTKNTPNSILAGALSQTPLEGAYSAPPDPPGRGGEGTEEGEGRVGKEKRWEEGRGGTEVAAASGPIGS